jgi:hypothetical protein
MLTDRRNSLRAFLATLDVIGFLKANGVSDRELDAVRAKLGVPPLLKWRVD